MVIQYLYTSSSLPSRHFYSPLYLFFNNVFHRAVPTPAVTNPVSLLSFLVCKIFVSSLTPLLHFQHDRSNWSSPSFSTTTFQNFPGISHLLSEVSKFQHSTKLCPKFSSWLVFSLSSSSSSSIGAATLVGFGLLNYRWVFSAGRVLQSTVASGTSNPQPGGPVI